MSCCVSSTPSSNQFIESLLILCRLVMNHTHRIQLLILNRITEASVSRRTQSKVLCTSTGRAQSQISEQGPIKKWSLLWKLRYSTISPLEKKGSLHRTKSFVRYVFIGILTWTKLKYQKKDMFCLDPTLQTQHNLAPVPLPHWLQLYHKDQRRQGSFSRIFWK